MRKDRERDTPGKVEGIIDVQTAVKVADVKPVDSWLAERYEYEVLWNPLYEHCGARMCVRSLANGSGTFGT